jgi:hypothetical protein
MARQRLRRVQSMAVDWTMGDEVAMVKTVASDVVESNDVPWQGCADAEHH